MIAIVIYTLLLLPTFLRRKPTCRSLCDQFKDRQGVALTWGSLSEFIVHTVQRFFPKSLLYSRSKPVLFMDHAVQAWEMNTPLLTVHCSNLIEESNLSLCLPWAFFRDCQTLVRKVFVWLEYYTPLLPGLRVLLLWSWIGKWRSFR